MTKGKKITVAVVAVAVIGLAAFWMTKSRFEKQAEAAVREALASVAAPNKVTADSVKADFLSRSLVIGGLRSEYRQGDSVFTGVTDSVRINGLDMDAFAGGKVAKLADEVLFSGVRLQGMGLEFSADRYDVKGVYGDAAQLRNLFADSAPYLHTLAQLKQDPSEDLLGKLFGEVADVVANMETLRVDRLEADGYRLDFPFPELGVLRLVIAESVTEDYSLRGAGKSHASDIRLSRGDTPLASISRISMDSAKWPEISGLLRAVASGDPETISRVMYAQKQETRNLVIEDIAVTSALMPIHIKAIRQDMVAAAQNDFAVKFEVEGVSMLAQDLIALHPNPESAIRVLPKEVLVDFFMDAQAAQKGVQAFDLELNTVKLAERTLGDVALTAKISDFDPEVGNGVLHSITLGLTDTGIIDLLVTAAQPFDQPQDVRAARAAALRAQEPQLPQAIRGLSADISAMLENPGGKLEITVAPQKPMSFLELMMASSMDPDVLGINSSYTRP